MEESGSEREREREREGCIFNGYLFIHSEICRPDKSWPSSRVFINEEEGRIICSRAGECFRMRW